MACFFPKKCQHFTAVTGGRSEKLLNRHLPTEAETRTPELRLLNNCKGIW